MSTSCENAHRCVEHLLWRVNIGSGNGLVPSGNKPCITFANVEPVPCRHMASLGRNDKWFRFHGSYQSVSHGTSRVNVSASNKDKHKNIFT